MIIKTNTWAKFSSLGCGRNCNGDTMVPDESVFLVSWAGRRSVRLGTGQCGNASPQDSFSCLFSPGPRRAQQNAGEVVWLGQTRDWRSRKVWSLREPTCEHRDWERVLADAQKGIGRWWKHCLHGLMHPPLHEVHNLAQSVSTFLNACPDSQGFVELDFVSSVLWTHCLPPQVWHVDPPPPSCSLRITA